MKRLVIFIGIFMLLGACIAYMLYVKVQNQPLSPSSYSVPSTDSFFLASAAFAPGSMMPSQYTCDGVNESPPLVFGNVPEKTKSLVLILDDQDTPQGTWVHWILWNISPTGTMIEKDSIPKGAVVGKNSFGNSSYGGPCPSSDKHRYVFRLYAIDTVLVVPPGSKKQVIIDAMNTHVIAQTEYTGVYARD